MTGWFSRIARYGGGLILAGFAAWYLYWLPFKPAGAPMIDFSSYYSAGRYWAAGGDPYSGGIWSVEKTLPGVDPTRHELLPYVGPPLSLPLWAALGRLPYGLAASLWGIVMVASTVVLVVVPTRLANRRIAGAGAASLLLLVIVAGPLVTGMSVGQAALPAAAAVDLAVLFAAARRWLPMAAAAFVAAALKPNDALAIGGAVQTFEALLATGGTAIASALANLPFAGGVHGLIAYVGVLGAQTASERFFTYQMSTTSIAYGLGLAQHAAQLLGACIAVAAVGAMFAAIRSTKARAVDAAAIVCALFPFAMPFVHEPDLSIVFLPALLVVYRATGWTWALGACGTVLLCVDAFAMGQGRLGLVFTVMTAAVAWLQVAALAPHRLRWPRLAPLGIVPLVLIMGFFAPEAHLPMWPTAQPAHVAIAPGASASTEWHDEIVASGLESRRPWIALMRLLTLCGCAGIGVAMIRLAAATSKETEVATVGPGAFTPTLVAPRTAPALIRATRPEEG